MHIRNKLMHVLLLVIFNKILIYILIQGIIDLLNICYILYLIKMFGIIIIPFSLQKYFFPKKL